MNLKQKAKRGFAWSVVETWGRQALNLGIFFCLARLLGPEDFGIVAIASIFVSFMSLFLDQGLSQAIIQKKDLTPEHLNTSFWINILFGILLVLLSIPTAYIASNFYEEESLKLVIVCLSSSFIFNSLSSVQEAILMRKIDFKSLAIRSFIATTISGAIGISMAIMGFGVWSLVGQQVSNSFVKMITLWSISSWMPKAEFSLAHFKELFAFGINVLGFKFVNFFNRRSDDLLIGYFLGPTQLGYYTVAYRLLLVLSETLISVISKVALPVFSRLQEEPEKLMNAFYSATKISSIISFPIFITASILSPEIISIVFGDQWNNSAPVMQILLLIGPIHSAMYFNSSVLLAIGKPAWRLGISFTNTVVNVSVFLMVVNLGIVAVATAYVVRGYVLFPFPLIVLKKVTLIRVKEYFLQYKASIISCVIMSFSMLLTRFFLGNYFPQSISLITLLVIGALTYTGSVLIFFPDVYRKLKISIQGAGK